MMLLMANSIFLVWSRQLKAEFLFPYFTYDLDVLWAHFRGTCCCNTM